MTTSNSRRQFIRLATSLAAAGVAAPLAIKLGAIASASAQAAPDYKALVCLYLGGGNDQFSTYVPFDMSSFATYQQLRGGLALDRASLLPISAASQQAGRQIALCSQFSGVKSLYDASRLAIVSNVGPLIEPTTKTDINLGRVSLPAQLGSHNDQSSTWQSLGTANPYGWGGLFGDALAGTNVRSNFTTIAANGGYSLMMVGAQTSFFTVNEYGAPSSFFDAGSTLDRVITGSAQRSNLLEKAYSQTHEVLRDGVDDLSSAILPYEFFTALEPGGGRNSLAQQLRTVARVIGGQAALGMKRQVFYVDMGGYDTHLDQAGRHPELMTQLNDALFYFDTLLGELNMRNNVTLFSTSEFGRHYAPNGDGTDHGWGSHHLIMGGAVRGGNIYGSLPNMDPDGPDFLDRAPMIPTISVEQYGATLGKWMGVSDTNLNTIFPNLGRFSNRDLGFMASV